MIGTSMFRRFIKRCRPSQWMRSIRSIDGRVGNDDVPGLARGPENSAPVPVRMTTRFSRSPPMSWNASGSSPWGRNPQRSDCPSVCKVTWSTPFRRSMRTVLYLFAYSSRARIASHGGGLPDLVEPRAIVPEDLPAHLDAERQPEELVHRLGKRAVGVRIVRRHHEVVGAHLVDDVDRRPLVDVERDVALALPVLARRHRELTLAARAELLPLVVQPPQPPVEPSRRALEERAAEAWVPFEDSAGRHAGDGAHQLHRIANGMGDRVEVGVPDVPSPGVVLERRVAGRMKSDRHVELLQRRPQRLARWVVQMLAIDRVRRADDRHAAGLLRSEEHTSELQ